MYDSLRTLCKCRLNGQLLVSRGRSKSWRRMKEVYRVYVFLKLHAVSLVMHGGGVRASSCGISKPLLSIYVSMHKYLL